MGHNIVYRRHDQAREVIPGSGILTPNASYELMKMSQKQRVPDERVETEKSSLCHIIKCDK